MFLERSTTYAQPTPGVKHAAMGRGADRVPRGEQAPRDPTRPQDSPEGGTAVRLRLGSELISYGCLN